MRAASSASRSASPGRSGCPRSLRRAAELGAGRRAGGAPRRPDGLSAREIEILVELARGRSNREIGRVLHISEHTAANHIRSILRKTGCANRTEAAGYALRRRARPGLSGASTMRACLST